MPEVDVLADSVFKAVESYLVRSLDQFTKRIDAVITERLEALPKAKDGEDGTPGKDGTSVDPEVIALMVSKAVAAIEIPVGPCGEKGEDGKDVDQNKIDDLQDSVNAALKGAADAGVFALNIDDRVSKVRAELDAVSKALTEMPAPKDGKDAIVDYDLIAEEIAKALTDLPKPKDGENGKDGEPGKDGLNGKDAEVNYLQVNELIKTQIEAWPKPKDGVDGKDGANGNDGLNGKDGSNGIDGKDGTSAYDIAKANGFEGTERNWLDSLRGIDGEKGMDGRDGRDAKDGRDGKDGEPGKDALEAKILRSIDPSRSYAKGTYAIHEGAWIQAKRVTGPISDGLEAAGWEVLLEYPSIIQMGFADDLRTFTVVAKTATGKRIEETNKIPVVLDCGVWQAGKNYERGDAVTFAGSMWIAQCETKASPGESPDWRLSVKRGRDGKDGRILEPVVHRPVTLR